MTQPTSTANYRKYPKGPNFTLVVFLSGVVMILVFIAAYLLLSDKGRQLLPKWHKPHQTSYLVSQPTSEAAA
ncbi:hypothetical protein RBB79_12105 [Tunturiibacter empetritectus]|uniref:Uncharacterized protein n=1 Tax=Tunturiibacter lichenicola TaxID=2051959 RepID=A0A852VFG4_9BACT|nr:hypothetical protein [Edaphobacter lichenicola]NYF90327.1 hypothetical protein [Edaphobacter lichenicola]